MSSPLERHAAARLLLSLLAAASACRPGQGETTHEPEPVADHPLPAFPSLEPEPTPVDLSPDALPEGAVAAVDGEPILAAELERLVTSFPPDMDPEQARRTALLQLVERRLLQSAADGLGVLVSEQEVQDGLDAVAASNGLSPEQLQAAVEQQGWTWDEYRSEVVAQLVEIKVLQVHGLFEAGPDDTEPLEARRERFFGCMRARAELQVADDSLALPDNPYALRSEDVTLRVPADVALPQAEIEQVAMAAAKTRLRLCDSLTSMELAVLELYLDRGYLDARVRMPWPQSTDAPVTIDARIVPGPRHVLGRVEVDQSALPKAQRVEPEDLRVLVAGYLTKGEPVSASAVREASEALRSTLRRRGLVPGGVEIERTPTKGSVRVDITFPLVVDTER